MAKRRKGGGWEGVKEEGGEGKGGRGRGKEG